MSIRAAIAALLLAAAAPAFGQQISGPPGTYSVSTAGGYSLTVKDGVATFTWTVGATPVPPPTPPPDPTPVPMPPTPVMVPEVQGPVHALVIDPTAKVAASDDVKAYALNREIVVLLLPPDSTPAWIDAAGRAGFPVSAPVVIVAGKEGADKGKVLHAQALPRTDAEWKAMIDKLKPAKAGR